MKTDAEMASEVISKAAAIKKRKSNRIKITLSTAFCFMLVLSAVVFHIYGDRYKSITTDGSSEGRSESSPLFDSSGIGANVRLSVLPDIKYTGSELTDDAVSKYLKLNRTSIISSLSASGVNTAGIDVQEKAYHHIKITEDNEATLDLSFADSLIRSTGGSVVAVVTMRYEDGNIYSTLSFGNNEYYKKLGSFLDDHSGEKLIFFYAGYTEAVLAPSGETFCPAYTESYSLFEDPVLAYKKYSNEKTVYIP